MKYKMLLGRILYIGCCLFLMGIAGISYLARITEKTAVTASATLQKTVYLTFDDGPSSNSQKILDVLDKHGVKATFFVTGQYEDYFNMLTALDSAGHLVAPHSNTHKFSQIYKSSEAFWKDQQDILNTILTYTAKTPNIMRFAGGSSNTVYRSYSDKSLMKRLTNECAERGITYVDWNVDSKDWQNNRSADSICKNVLAGMKECTDSYYVILMHDCPSAPNTAAALDSLIVQLTALGYSFDTLDHLSVACHHGL